MVCIVALRMHRSEQHGQLQQLLQDAKKHLGLELDLERMKWRAADGRSGEMEPFSEVAALQQSLAKRPVLSRPGGSAAHVSITMKRLN